MEPLRTSRGRSLPLGATAVADGINFSLLTRHGSAVWLVLYPMDRDEPISEVSLHPRKNRTGNHWHILVGGLPETFPLRLARGRPRGGGHRFDPSIILLDPSATALSDGAIWGRPREHDATSSRRRSLFFPQAVPLARGYAAVDAARRHDPL